MPLELKADMWVYGIWYVQGKDCDWMGSLSKQDDKVVLEYRFRYYKDDRAFDSKDTKNWYTGSSPVEDLEKNLAGFLSGVLPIIEQYLDSKADFVDLQCSGDDPKVLFELGSRPWASLRIETTN